MSELWKYFNNILRLSWLHHKEPLQGVAQGLAHTMDQSQRDIVHLREQFFPQLCEKDMVALHGTSRGLVRHQTESDDDFRARVAHAYAWHMLGGKVEGLPEILKFYGFPIEGIYSRRNFIPSRWAEFEIKLHDFSSPADLENGIANLESLMGLVQEYKPARSLFARIYTQESDGRFFIWSRRGVWSRHYWSQESGIYDDASGVLISLGYRNKTNTEPLTVSLQWGRHATMARFIRYSRAWMWSQSRWGDALPMMHSFSHGQLASYILERMQKPWSFRGRSVVREQLTWSGNTSTVGAWSDINARYSRRAYDLVDNPPRWGSFRYGDSVGKRTVIPEERFRQIRKTVFSVPEFITTTCHQNLGGHIASLYPQNTWTGKWDSRSWTPTPPVLRKSTQI